MKPIKLIAFDYDGVIADSFDHNLEIVNQALCEINHHTLSTADDIRTLRKMTFVQLGHNLGVPPEQISDWEMTTARELIRTTDCVDFFPGTAELLADLASRYKLAVISNTISDAINKILKLKGLDHCFVSIYGGDHEGSKADKIRDLAERFEVSTSEVCMVGDAMSDVEAGSDAGAQTVAVTWGFQARELLSEVNPDHIVENHEELTALFTHGI